MNHRSTSHVARRIARLLRTLVNGRKSLSELAVDLECSERTVLRYIAALEEAGLVERLFPPGFREQGYKVKYGILGGREARYEMAIYEAIRALKCCPQMTIDVPEDSREAGITYCPRHGRHEQKKIFNALVILERAVKNVQR